MWRRAGGLVLRAAVTIFLTLLVFELGVRAIPLYPDTFEVPDPNYGWRLTPNQSGTYLNILCLGEFTNRVTINGQGLHDVDHAYEPVPGVERILFIGDSMVAGFEVPLEQTFYRRLESLLNANNGDDGRRYEVIGAGHRGYGTDLELLFYEHEAHRYQADMVVLVMQPGNDIRDNHPELRPLGASGFPYFTVEDGQLSLHQTAVTSIPVNPAVPSLNPIHDALYQISHLYRLLYRRVSVAQGVRQTDAVTADPEVTARTAKAFEEAWELLRALLTRFRDRVEADGGQFAVMVATSTLLTGETGEQIYQALYDLLHELEIDYLTLQPVFTADKLPSLQYGCDQHWKPAGHTLVAEQLAAFLPPLMEAKEMRASP